MPTHGRSEVRTTDLLYRTRQRYPYSTPPKYFAVTQMSGCPWRSPRHSSHQDHLSELTNSTSFGTACPTVFFPALTASSCGRRVQHGGGELLALLFSLTSRHRLARESTAPKFYVFAQLCLLVHHHNSLRPSSVNTTPGLSKVSHSQLRQLHADKIMTFRHPTIA